MKILYSLFIFSFLSISPILVGQSVCEQFVAAVKKSNHGQNKNRSYRMTMQSTDDVRTNITEADSLGRIHFFGNIGSLRIESYEAEKKRYAKIISEYLVNDDWTWREVKANDALSTLWFDIAGRNLQINDCQVIGEETLQQKKCHILSYYIHQLMPKDNGVDFFFMKMAVKTWFCADDNLVYKSTYEMTTDRFMQYTNATIEYDLPIQIEMPKDATYESLRGLSLVTIDNQELVQQIPTILLDSVKTSEPTSEPTIALTTIDQIPEYKEGMTGLLRYVNQNLQLPKGEGQSGVYGTVSVGFIVERDGTLSNVKIKRSVRDDIDRETIKVIESMSGAWKAGKREGKDVRAAYTLPLRFDLR